MPKRKQSAIDAPKKFTSISIGVEVHCSDGIGGRVTRVITDPASRRGMDLVVREEKWPHTRRLVPIKWIVEATDTQIRLGCTKDELAKMGALVEINAYQKRYPPVSGCGDGHILWPHSFSVSAKPGPSKRPTNDGAYENKKEQ
jgi:hypothetical protein